MAPQRLQSNSVCCSSQTISNRLQSSPTISNLGDFNRADANGRSPEVTSHETQLPGKGKEQPLGEGGKIKLQLEKESKHIIGGQTEMSARS